MAIQYQYPRKNPPAGADLVLISDTEDTLTPNATKSVTVQSIVDLATVGAAGVSSLNTLTGALTLAGGVNITTISSGGNTITVNFEIEQNLDLGAYDLTSTSGVKNGLVNIVAGGTGGITLNPDTGYVVIDKNTWPNADGTAGQVLITDGGGTLSWSALNSSVGPGTQLTFPIFATTTTLGDSVLVQKADTTGINATYELGLLGNGTSHGLLKIYCEAGSAHYVGIKGPNHTGGVTYTLQLPNALPAVANQILESNASGTLSWIPTPSSGGTPGGSTTQVQFNDSGAFAGEAELTYNKTSNTLTTDNVAAKQFTSGESAITSSSGAATWNASQGTFGKITLTENTTLAITNLPVGTPAILKVTQAAGSSFNITAYTVSGGAVVWPGGTVPTITATVNSVDIISFLADSADIYASANQDFK